MKNYIFVSRQLVGYSFGDSFPFHKASQFNLAEIGAVSTDMPYMVSAIIAIFLILEFNHLAGTSLSAAHQERQKSQFQVRLEDGDDNNWR